MTALTMTAASISLDSGPHDADAIAGEAFAAGAVVYQRASDSKWLKAQCDGTAEEAGSVALGIALGTADAAGARVSIARDGAVISIGVAATAGFYYCPGRTAGALIPTADLASTDKSTLIAQAISTSKLLLQRVYNAGSVVA